MYEKFFSLKKKPFDLVPNPEFLFLSRSHKKAITYLDYGIKEKMGFVLLTGEVGSGKTTIVRNLIKELNGKVRLSKVFNTKVSSEQLIAMINEDFGLNVKGKDKITLIRELNAFLIEQYANKYQSILIIDEAQNLTSELLEEVRLLSNLETDDSTLLQIILVGQPELRNTLAQPQLRQLRQRISVSCNIKPLTREETEEYIFYRFEIAGNRGAIVFHDETIDVIHNFSRGIPRLINIICDFLMLSAFVEEKRELSLDMVKEVIGEVEMENRYWQDEPQEHFFSGNESILKEIVNRICRLEEEFFRKNISDNEKAEIFERLSHTENLLNKFVSSIKNNMVSVQEDITSIRSELGFAKHEITMLSDTVSDVQGEVVELKRQSVPQPLQQTEEKPKKGFLRSLWRTKNKNTCH